MHGFCCGDVLIGVFERNPSETDRFAQEQFDCLFKSQSLRCEDLGELIV